MAGDERIRLFCGLPLPDEARDELAAWGDVQLPAGRRVRPEDLHVTLAFLGSRPAAEVPRIAAELRAAAAAAAPAELRPRRYRETRSVGMIVLDDRDGRATDLADDLQERLERLGVYRRERRPWLPHVTVLRFRERAGLQPRGGEHVFDSCRPVGSLPFFPRTRRSPVRRTRNGSPRRRR